MQRFLSVSGFLLSAVFVFTGVLYGCSSQNTGESTLPRKSAEQASSSKDSAQLYRKGLGYYSMWIDSDRTVETYLLRALSLLKKSCDRNNEKACMAYLMISSEQKKSGTDMSLGSEMCLRGYPEACRIFWKGMKSLSVMEFPAAVSIYGKTIEKACLSGLLEPCRLLTDRKYGKKSDTELASWLARSAISTGNSQFEFRLYRLMVRDFRNPIFTGDSSGLLEELFRAGSRIMGMYAALALYYGWWGLERDRSRAVSLFFEGCRVGYVPSCRAYFYLASVRGDDGSRRRAMKAMDSICSGRWKNSMRICFMRDFLKCRQKNGCGNKRTLMETFLDEHEKKKASSGKDSAREAMALMFHIKMQGKEHDGKYLKSVLAPHMDTVTRACWSGSPWFCRTLTRMGYEPLLVVKRTHMFIKEITSIPEDDLLLDVVLPFSY